MDVLVEFDYTAEEPDELTIRKGEVIKDVAQFEEGWYIGSLNGKIGVFPDNFVKVLNEASKDNNSNIATVETVKEPIKHEVNSNAASELEDNAKNSLVSKRPTGIGLGNIFSGKPIQLKHTSIKEVLRDTESNSDKTLNSDQAMTDRVRALYPYQPAQPDELELLVDDVIQVLNRTTREEGWWQGRNLRTRKIGLFPDNFVSSIKDHEEVNEAASTDTAGSGGRVNSHNSPHGLQNGNITISVNGSSPANPNSTFPLGSEPPKVAVKPKNVTAQINAAGSKLSPTSNGPSVTRDIPKSTMSNVVTGRFGPTNDIGLHQATAETNTSSSGQLKNSQYRTSFEQKEGKTQSGPRRDEGSSDFQTQRSEALDAPGQRLTGPTADRPKQTGRRLPSKFSCEPSGAISKDASSMQSSQIPRCTPTSADELPSHTDTSEHSRSFGGRRATDSAGKNSRGPLKTTVSLNRSDGTIGSDELARPGDMPSTRTFQTPKMQSQSPVSTNHLLLEDVKQQLTNAISQLDHLKEANNQLRSDMEHGQRLLTERMHCLTNELDEVRKQRAADAIELSRLRTLLTQLDSKALTSFGSNSPRRSSSCTSSKNAHPMTHVSQSLDSRDNAEHLVEYDDEPNGSLRRMVGDSYGGPPPTRIFELNPSQNSQTTINKSSLMRNSPCPKVSPFSTHAKT